jgi:hypothetical protein
MIKIAGAPGATNASIHEDSTPQPAAHPGLVAANYTTHEEPIEVVAPPPKLPLEVSYRNGLLGIRSDKATLSEVLYAIQQRTGADIAIPAGAEQEKVVAEIEPAPAPEVLARLLNGSRFNFLILNSPDDPSKLGRVILTTRADGGNFIAPPPVAQNNEDSEDDEPAVVRNQPPNNPTPNPAPVETPSRPVPDQNATAADENPKQ